MDIHKIITEFKGTTFHEHYRAEDWLLHKLMEIEKEHKEELEATETILRKKST